MPNLSSARHAGNAAIVLFVLCLTANLMAQVDRCRQAEERESAEYSSRMRAIDQKRAAAGEQHTRDREACGTSRACQDAADRRHEQRLKQLDIEGNDEKTRHSKARVDIDLQCSTDCRVPESRQCRQQRAEECRRYAENMAAIKKEEYDTWNQNFRDLVACPGGPCRRDVERKAEERSKQIEAKNAAENKRHEGVNLQLDQGNCALEEMVVTAKLLPDCLPAPTAPQRQEIQSGLDELNRFFFGPGQSGLPVVGMGQQADITVTTMGVLTKEYLEGLRDEIPAAIQRLQHPESIITDEVRRQVEGAARRYQEAQAAVRYLSNDDARQEMNDQLWEDAKAAVDSVRQNPARAVGAIAFQVIKDKIQGAITGAGGFCPATPRGRQLLQGSIDRGRKAVQRFPNFKPPQRPSVQPRQPAVIPQRPQGTPAQRPPVQPRQPGGPPQRERPPAPSEPQRRTDQAPTRQSPPPQRQPGIPPQRETPRVPSEEERKRQQREAERRRQAPQSPPPQRSPGVQPPKQNPTAPSEEERKRQQREAERRRQSPQSPPQPRPPAVQPQRGNPPASPEQEREAQRRQDGVIEQGKTPPKKEPTTPGKDQDKTRPIQTKEQDKTKPIPVKDQDKTKPISQQDKDKGKDLPKQPDK
jgi:hypothetical protein